MLRVTQSSVSISASRYTGVSFVPFVTIDVVMSSSFARRMRSGSQGQRVGSPPAKLILSKPADARSSTTLSDSSRGSVPFGSSSFVNSENFAKQKLHPMLQGFHKMVVHGRNRGTVRHMHLLCEFLHDSMIQDARRQVSPSLLDKNPKTPQSVRYDRGAR